MSSSPSIILCVEDDVDTQEMMRVMIGGWGYGFEVVGTCTDALQLIRGSKLAAVLLDNSLPDCTGIDLCRQVRQFDTRLPIIFLSGSAHDDERQLALDSGANVFLSKPFGLEALLEVLNTYAPL
ncbi:MAG TPA: response regulator [Blastocatellia bacterium]|nr:response regulator [Blastocatellia bacterium]